MIIYDNKKLQIEQDKEILSFTGIMDEFFLFHEMTCEKYQHYVLDLQKLRIINSCGVRELISWLNSQAEGTLVEFINCPVFFVQQANMVNGIVNSTRRIKSFYAPYFNEIDETEHDILVLESEILNLKAPIKSGLIFDSIENKFFNFLSFQNDRK